MANLDLYNRVCAVPENALKDFNNGSFKGTDINPMWRIKTLTKEFGECGKGWYYEIVDRWKDDGADNQVCVFITVNLYVKYGDEWSKPIQGTGGNTLTKYVNKSGGYLKTTDEAYKMALTDALSIACKALGIGADVWWKEEKTKYTDTPTDNYQPPAPTAPFSYKDKLQRSETIGKILILAEEQEKTEVINDWLKDKHNTDLEHATDEVIEKVFKQLGGK